MNFKPDTILCEGVFGTVYKGWVDDKTFAPSNIGVGLMIAVKKLNPDSLQGLEEWQYEINLLGTLSQPNLVNLVGYCCEDNEFLLVYEFMAKGSLENHLFQIFGLAKNGPVTGSHVTTMVMGTFGYAAPEYVATAIAIRLMDISVRSEPEAILLIKSLQEQIKLVEVEKFSIRRIERARELAASHGIYGEKHEQVEAEIVQIEADDVPVAISNEVSKSQISMLVIGASSGGSFTRLNVLGLRPIYSDKPDEAISLFHKMILREERFNLVTMPSLLDALFTFKFEVRRSRCAHGLAIRCGLAKEVEIGTALLDMYSKCGAINASRRVFDQMG
ncbi:hypothetical protein Scep_030469 [Stephania cephalantha]|uniref:Protein kinase domain-containing protein n=1 Tax=Stephania cephalantha TaxID=152367 RepID=A0AAP0HD63_9MAGN